MSGGKHSRIARHLRNHSRLDRSRATRIINHIVDRSQIPQPYGSHVVELHSRRPRYLNRTSQHYSRLTKHTVNPEAPGLMARHTVRHLVRGPTIHTRRAHIALLVRRIIRNLRLIEIRPPTIAIPKHLELLVVLHEQPIDRDIVPVHDQTV